MTESEDIMCMKALYDVNIPKFLTNDIPLFKDITRDLFPGETLPDFKRIELEIAIQEVCEQLGLKSSSRFLEKCIQLFDTNNVRHGYMVVGDTCVGKTRMLQVMELALTKLHKKKD